MHTYITKVPLVLGSLFPSRDSSDREYYCKTMLTLLKPFSTGLKLKDADEIWDAAFDKFDFRDKQRNLMGNFHVLHECNDAQHEFAKQCKAHLPTFSTVPDGETLPEFGDDEMDLFLQHSHDKILDDIPVDKSKWTIENQLKINEMEGDLK